MRKMPPLNPLHVFEVAARSAASAAPRKKSV
jgi:hypothetical protein